MNAVPAPRRSPWPYIVAGMLLTHVAAMAFAVRLASGDSGHAVLPDYYDHAVRWDELRAEEALSRTLGWELTLTPATLCDPDGLRDLRLGFADDRGAPVEGLEVALRVYHTARAEPIDALALPLSGAPGHHVAALPMERAGAWQVEVRATRGAEVFVAARTLQVAAPVLASSSPETERRR